MLDTKKRIANPPSETYFHRINGYRECRIIPSHFRIGYFLYRVLMMSGSDSYDTEYDHEKKETDANHNYYGDRVT